MQSEGHYATAVSGYTKNARDFPRMSLLSLQNVRFFVCCRDIEHCFKSIHSGCKKFVDNLNVHAFILALKKAYVKEKQNPCRGSIFFLFLWKILQVTFVFIIMILGMKTIGILGKLKKIVEPVAIIVCTIQD